MSRSPSSVAARPAADCTFVCCVESGPLEPMTVRLVESLRRFGGSLAASPVVAVTPRPGPRLARATRERLRALEVDLVHLEAADPYTWYHFLNKARALAAVERQLSTSVVAFLDSDVLVVAEPRALLLDSGIDFVAKPEEGSIETTGEGDHYEALWKGLTGVLGLDLAELPWVELPASGRRARFYVNSGVFAYRRERLLAATYLETAVRLLAARIACRRSGVHWIEQAALGLAVIRSELSWRPLAAGYNFSVTGWGKGFRGLAAPAGTCVVHYHNSMHRESWPALLDWLDGQFPAVQAWLRDQGALRSWAPFHHRLESGTRGLARRLRRRRFLASCRIV